MKETQGIVERNRDRMRQRETETEPDGQAGKQVNRERD